MNEVYLHKDDLQKIIDFLNAFPNADTVLITSDNSSGIGAIVKAHIPHTVVNDYNVTVTMDIVDESSW